MSHPVAQAYAGSNPVPCTFSIFRFVPAILLTCPSIHNARQFVMIPVIETTPSNTCLIWWILESRGDFVPGPHRKVKWILHKEHDHANHAITRAHDPARPRTASAPKKRHGRYPRRAPVKKTTTATRGHVRGPKFLMPGAFFHSFLPPFTGI